MRLSEGERRSMMRMSSQLQYSLNVKLEMLFLLQGIVHRCPNQRWQLGSFVVPRCRFPWIHRKQENVLILNEKVWIDIFIKTVHRDVLGKTRFVSSFYMASMVVAQAFDP
jgi:hypothetical protein